MFLPGVLQAVVLSVLGVSALPPQSARWKPNQFDTNLQGSVESDVTRPWRPVLDRSFDTDGQGLGSVSAVGVDSQGHVFVFHRADRPWTAETFQESSNKLSAAARAPIQADTIWKLNPSTGQVVQHFGGHFFNVPHGLKVDQHDNLWLTDVGRHQVFRFPKNGTSPDLVLGEVFVPGDDHQHFCKPTDVAVSSSGDFFVADGYCNSRILKYSKDGKFLTQWGTKTTNADLGPYTLNIPHSLTLVEEQDLVCVADRDNERVLCYNAGLGSNTSAGTFNRTVVAPGELGPVFAVSFSPVDGELILAAGDEVTPLESSDGVVFPARAFTYGLDGQARDAWAYVTPEIASRGPSTIHGLVVSPDGRHYFLADLSQQRVFKYTKVPDWIYQ